MICIRFNISSKSRHHNFYALSSCLLIYRSKITRKKFLLKTERQYISCAQNNLQGCAFVRTSTPIKPLQECFVSLRSNWGHFWRGEKFTQLKTHIKLRIKKKKAVTTRALSGSTTYMYNDHFSLNSTTVLFRDT